MGFLEILTLLFIALKLMGFISWSWLIVLLPEIIAFVIYILMISIFGSFIGIGLKIFNKRGR